MKPLIIFLILMHLGLVKGYTQVINAGVGGNTTLNLLERLDEDVLKHKPDLVIVMVGTNDMLNSKKMISYKQYKKNLKKILRRIKRGGANIVLMTSPPVDSVYLFQRHKRRLFTEMPNVKLDSIRNIVSRIARKNKWKYLDLYQTFSEMHLPKHNEDLFFRNEKNSGAKDGVHPTALGYRFIGELVFYHLKENNLLSDHQRIVCFGDSITNGSGVKDKAQAYPGVLEGFISRYEKKKNKAVSK